MKLLRHLAPVLLISLLGSAALSAQTITAPNLATLPVPRNEWIVRHEGFNAIAQKGGVDLLFVGDSITDGWRGAGKTLWAERYEPLKAANFGIGGDKTEHVLWRLQNGNLDGIQPKVAVLMIGTNNTARDTAPQIAEGVTAIVNEIHKRCPATKVLLLAVFPRAEKADNPLRAKIAEINGTIAKLDDGRKVFFLDINQKFLEADGTLPKSIMPDALHPNAAGYQIWADAMQEKVTALLK
jgi:lysophospholipase L1-like esterase